MTGFRHLLGVALAILMPGLCLAGSFPVMVNGRGTCEALWVERNQFFNVAGYCFGSALGQAVFDNDDCSSNAPPQLDEKATSRVESLLAVEARLGCEIDTGQGGVRVYGRNGPIQFGQGGTVLGMWPRALRRVDVFPVNPHGHSSCTVVGLNPNGDNFLALRSGPDVRYRQIGRLVNGDQVLKNTQCIGAWCFASESLRDGATLPMTGWFHANWCQ